MCLRLEDGPKAFRVNTSMNCFKTLGELERGHSAHKRVSKTHNQAMERVNSPTVSLFHIEVSTTNAHQQLMN